MIDWSLSLSIFYEKGFKEILKQIPQRQPTITNALQPIYCVAIANKPTIINSQSKT